MTPEEIRITFAAAAFGGLLAKGARDGHAADECWKLADLALRSDERRKIDGRATVPGHPARNTVVVAPDTTWQACGQSWPEVGETVETMRDGSVSVLRYVGASASVAGWRFRWERLGDAGSDPTPDRAPQFWRRAP